MATTQTNYQTKSRSWSAAKNMFDKSSFLRSFFVYMAPRKMHSSSESKGYSRFSTFCSASRHLIQQIRSVSLLPRSMQASNNTSFTGMFRHAPHVYSPPARKARHEERKRKKEKNPSAAVHQALIQFQSSTPTRTVCLMRYPRRPGVDSRPRLFRQPTSCIYETRRL